MIAGQGDFPSAKTLQGVRFVADPSGGEALNELDKLRSRLDAFARDRDWEQFHSPKNLSMALSVEVAEIAEHFQWLTEQQSRDLGAAKRAEVEQELADVLIYLVRLADQLGIDLLEAAQRKLAVNEARYPADKVRGSSRKYSEYD